MKHRGSFLAVASIAVMVAVPSTDARSEQFDGKVCALVTAAAQRTADAPASCVQSTMKSLQPRHATVWVADWGTSNVPGGPDHFMTVQVGPPAVAIDFRKAPNLKPILPKYVGPVQIAAGVKGYYALSGYKGTAGGRGTIRFMNGGYRCEITIVDVSSNVLPGLLAVAKSAAQRL